MLYKKLGKGVVECLACEWRCKIGEGKTGICGVRQNQGGKLKLLVDGRAVAVNIDPVEKKPLFHFLPGTGIFSLGTLGCNLGCDFCQNWDISQASKSKGKKIDWGRKLGAEEIVKICKEKEIKSIAFTYNEPTIFSEYAVKVMKAAKEEKIKGVYVTNGFMTKDCLDFIDKYIDAFNVDLKAFNPEYYRRVCRAKIEPVLRNIKEIYKRGKWLEVTTLIVPGENDSKGELSEIAGFLAGISADIPWHISAFYPSFKRGGEATKREKLEEAYEIGKKMGLNYVYVGNIADESRSRTICPGCGKAVIARQGYRVENKLKEGRCPYCGLKIKGVWQ